MYKFNILTHTKIKRVKRMRYNEKSIYCICYDISNWVLLCLWVVFGKKHQLRAKE